jgi:stearoyl-CoA desaturase (delta-9 desaturase)
MSELADTTTMTTARKPRDPARAVLPAARFRRQQYQHFVLCQALPMLLTLALPFALPEGWHAWKWVVLMLGMWLLVGGFGVSVGMHRHFAHRAFSAPKWVRVALAIAGSMAAQGPVSYWVGIHRRHHTFSDEPGDPHSPHQAANGARGPLSAFLHGHVMWAISHDVPMPTRYSADLIRDPVIASVDRRYWWIVGAGIVIPGIAGLAMHGGFEGFLLGAYWGGIVRIALGHHVIWAINSFCHAFGRRPYETTDKSRNFSLLSILSFGESWHNNHHESPTCAQFAHHWWQIDIGWSIIKLMRALRMAGNVKCHVRAAT